MKELRLSGDLLPANSEVGVMFSVGAGLPCGKARAVSQKGVAQHVGSLGTEPGSCLQGCLNQMSPQLQEALSGARFGTLKERHLPDRHIQ